MNKSLHITESGKLLAIYIPSNFERGPGISFFNRRLQRIPAWVNEKRARLRDPGAYSSTDTARDKSHL